MVYKYSDGGPNAWLRIQQCRSLARKYKTDIQETQTSKHVKILLKKNLFRSSKKLPLSQLTTLLEYFEEQSVK